MEPISTQKQRDVLKAQYSKCLFSLFSLVKTCQLYDTNHPSVDETLNTVLASCKALFQQKMEIIIGQSEGLFLAEDFFFFEESLTMFSLLNLIEQKMISSFIFLPQVTKEELRSFAAYLIKDANTPNSPHSNPFSTANITIKVKKIDAETALQRQKKKQLREKSIRQDWAAKIDALFDDVLAKQEFVMSDCNELLDILIDRLQHQPESISSAMANSIGEFNLSAHAYRTMALSLYMGVQLGFDPQTLKLLGVCAVFHDVGRLVLPSDFKTGFKLIKQDLELAQAHSELGASLLLGVKGLMPLAARVALEHHCHANLSGTPKLPASIQPHPFSSLVEIADFISWGTVRPSIYHKPESLPRLLRLSMSRSGTWFDPMLVKLLLPFFGVFPPGAEVTMADGRTGLVMECNTKNILRPLVAFYSGPEQWQQEDLNLLTNTEGSPFSGDISHLIKMNFSKFKILKERQADSTAE